MSSEETSKVPGIGLWKSKDGHYRTSVRGLTQEQVDVLKGLAVGDRITAFVSDGDAGVSYPDITLRKSTPRAPAE